MTRNKSQVLGKDAGSSAATRLLAALLAGLLVAIAAQDAGASADLPAMEALRDRIESSYRERDLAGIEAARRELLASGGERSAYYAAYARFRQGLAAEGDRDAAGGYVDDCIGELRPFVERHPGDAEARALLGSCYGVSTRYHPFGMAGRGLEARRHMAAARALAPENPWVMLQDGLADYSTPRLFGGDRELALTKLERAAALFSEAARQGSSNAAWGAEETRLQLARMR